MLILRVEAKGVFENSELMEAVSTPKPLPAIFA